MGLMEDIMAEAQLKEAGSVMAKPQQPDWRKNLPRTLGPTAGTGVQAGMDLLDAVLKLGNPLENISGPAQAVLGPIGRATPALVGKGAKAINQAQKKIVKALFRGDPETLKEVVASPRMMHVGVPGAGGGLPKKQTQQLIDEVMNKSFAHYQPSSAGGTVRVDPRVMRGKDVRKGFGTLTEQVIEGLPDMAVHEATHFLNEPMNRQASEVLRPDLRRLAGAIEPFIGQAAFGPKIVDQLTLANPRLAVNEALSYLSQPTGRTPAATWLH